MAPLPSMPSALAFDLVTKCSTTKARASILTLPHGPVELPLFMPVATQASLKGLTPQQLEETGCRLCLNNAYHLGLKPGQEVLEAVGGAHKFQGWKHNILTDSGGYGNISIDRCLLNYAEIYTQFPNGISPQVSRNYRRRRHLSLSP